MRAVERLAEGRIGVALLIAIATWTSTFTAPAAARAEPEGDGTQTAAANAGFLDRMPAPGSVAEVCLVDSGVDLVPELAGRVVARYAVDVSRTADTQQHGTLVAQVLAGVGYLRFGIWPHARIISVKADARPDGSFGSDDLETAIRTCLQHPDVRVINMSLGLPHVDVSNGVRGAVAAAVANDVNVVMAAGNRPSDPVNTLAQLPDVISVGGIDDNGRTCGSVAAATTIRALACAVQTHPAGHNGVAYVDGTSFAAPQVSAALAALRSYQPGLNASQTRAFMLAGARSTDAGVALDVQRMFELAHVDIPRPRELQLRRVKLPRPRMQRYSDERYMYVALMNKPDGSRAIARRGGHVVASTTGWRLKLLRRHWKPVVVTYVSEAAESLPLTIRRDVRPPFPLTPVNPSRRASRR